MVGVLPLGHHYHGLGEWVSGAGNSPGLLCLSRQGLWNPPAPHIANDNALVTFFRLSFDRVASQVPLFLVVLGHQPRLQWLSHSAGAAGLEREYERSDAALAAPSSCPFRLLQAAGSSDRHSLGH